MTDLSTEAFVIAWIVFLLSIAYIHLSSATDSHCRWRSCFVIFFAILFVASVVCFALWRRFEIQHAYLLVLELPWIHGLSTEVYTLWQLYRALSSVLHDRFAINAAALFTGLTGLVFVILQLYSLHAPGHLPNSLNALAFSGNAIFHVAAASALGHVLYRGNSLQIRWFRFRGNSPETRRLRFITAVFTCATIIDIPIIVLFLHFPNEPLYCLTRCSQGCIVVFLLLLPRGFPLCVDLWKRFRNRKHEMSCKTTIDVERSPQTSIPLSSPALGQPTSLADIGKSPRTSMSCSSERVTEGDIESAGTSNWNEVSGISITTITTSYTEYYGLPTPPSSASSTDSGHTSQFLLAVT